MAFDSPKRGKCIICRMSSMVGVNAPQKLIKVCASMILYETQHFQVSMLVGQGVGSWIDDEKPHTSIGQRPRSANYDQYLLGPYLERKI